MNRNNISTIISNDIDDKNKLSNLFYILIIFSLSIIGTLANFIVIAAYRLSINYKMNQNNKNNFVNFGSTYAIDEFSGKKKYKIIIVLILLQCTAQSHTV